MAALVVEQQARQLHASMAYLDLVRAVHLFC